jgi:hypothetical protein
MIKYLVTTLARWADIHKSDIIDQLKADVKHWKLQWSRERLKNWILRERIHDEKEKTDAR